MAYHPLTDFIALTRRGPDGVVFERMPGLDYVVAALGRAGLSAIWVGQTAPTANESVTVWVRPANPSWTTEGTVLLWNATSLAYEPATPALWSELFVRLGLGPALTTWRAQTFYGAAAPVSGAHERGDKVWNTQPSPGGAVGWVCVTAGAPGVWRSFGAIAP